LPDILGEIVKGKIQLPDFQRGWIWDDEHVRSLLVSIARSFPVGAVMLLETGGEARFQVRPVENVPFSGALFLAGFLAITGSPPSWSSPRAGESQCANRLFPVAKNAPAPIEPIARMIIGTVITGGDSCGSREVS